MSDLSDTPSRPATPTADHIPTARPYRFTWDPSTRRPGPESVSGTTEGRGADYFNPPTPTPFPLGVLNTYTTSLTLGALPNEWSSSKHGFHAISTVLNNPHKRQDPPKAHSSLPAVPPADLPRVRRKDFDSYLRAIAPEWERFERNNRLGREGQAQLDSQEHGDDNITPRASIASDSAQLTPIAGAPSRRASVIPTPTSATSRTIPPLETVPSVFFQPAFDLADPVIFAKVAEQPDDANSRLSPTTPTQATTSSSRSTNASSSAPTPMDYITDPMSSLSHTPPLLDKFSHYADTVEQHLVREISIRSTSFFAALTNLQELQSESDVCLDRIARLRNLLKDVDEKTAKKGLEVVRKCGEVGRVQNVKDAVRGVGGVVEMTKVARGLVGAGQYGEALGVVEALERMWEGESEEERREVNGRLETMVEESEDGQITQEQEQKTLGFPLSGLTAFSELPNHLRVLTLEIATSLSQEMVVVLRHDLEERISRSQGTPDVKVNGNAGDKEKVEGLQDRLKPSLQNLVRTRGLRDAILSWREFVLGEVKGVVKGAVSGFDKEWDEDKEENRTNLIQHLKSMQHTEFMPILQQVYQHFLALIEGIQTQNNVINDLLESIQTTLAKRPSTSKKATASLNITEDLIDLLASTTELSHTTCSKLLHARTETHALLPLPSFLTLYIDSMSFVVKCEVICRRMIIGLRGVVLRQASVYLSKFHQGRIERCARVVLDEPWNQVEVGGEVQDIVDILVKCAVMDAEELRIEVEGVVIGGLGAMMNGVNGKGSGNGRSVAHSPVKSNSTSPTVGGGVRILPSTKSYAELSDPGTVLISGANKSAKGNPKHLKIEDRSYYIVAATAEVLILLVDYLKIVVNLSTLTKDTISKVVEFLMTFNSRTCQLVLGAGAMRSAGLKHITAKHLALASQSLSVVSELVPYVRETFRRHLNQAEAVLLVDFDKLKRDYQVHQTEIHAKLISIMGDRLTAHIESLKAIDWSQPSDGGVNTYMQTLVKETVTLHKVLSRYLSAAVVEYVMAAVFAGINHRLAEVYGKIELPNLEAKARLLTDAKFLHKELSGLKNVMAPMGMLETVVSEKQVPRANVPPTPVTTPTRSNTLTANQRLKGLLSRSSTITNNTHKAVEKALPIPNQTAASPRTSTSTPPPPPLPAKSPTGSIFMQNALASMSTLALSSEASSTSNLPLNVSTTPVIPDRVFSASPPPLDNATEIQGKLDGASSLTRQNGHTEEVRTPIGSPRMESTLEPRLPETPSAERGSDMKV